MRGHRDELPAGGVVGSLVRILVACEFSGTVRDAFNKRGHYAVSCDLLPSDNGGPHFQGDVLDILGWGWDLMVAHPPCTYLSVSGQRWCSGDSAEAAERRVKREQAVEFFRKMLDAPVPRIAVENPVSIASSRIRKPDQTFHPHHFGHPSEKRTCLWLKNLPKLRHTSVVEPEYHVSGTGRRWSKWFWDTSMMPVSIRGHERSKTFQGIADAMAEQWGVL